MSRDSSADSGSVALEFLLVGLIAPVLVVGGVLSLASAQRAQIAAQQLAREYVRSQVLGESPEVAEPMRQSIADGLHLSIASVQVSARSLDGSNLIEARAIVGQAVEIARMRVQP